MLPSPLTGINPVQGPIQGPTPNSIQVPDLPPLGDRGVVFGQGNMHVPARDIRQFLSTPNLTNQQILQKAQQTGVSLNQLRQAAPNDPRFAASNPNLLPFLASQGITPPNITPAPLPPLGNIPPPMQGQIPTGLVGSEMALQGGLAAALSGIMEGIQQNRQALSVGSAASGQAINQGVENLQPFAGPGGGAINMQAALSGALGPNSQAEAFTNFTSSPGQDFLRKRGEAAVLRNASAMGGLGGGRVRQALQREGIGFAQQDLDNQFSRLSDVTRTGVTASGQQANLRGQQANIMGNLAQTGAQAALTGGMGAAQLGFDTGQSLAAGRTRVGEQLAGEVSNTTSALAELINQQGRGVSDLTGSTSGNLSTLLSAATQAQESGQTQLATLLANLASGTGSSLAQVRPLQGIAGPILDAVGKVASGVGAVVT